MSELTRSNQVVVDLTTAEISCMSSYWDEAKEAPVIEATLTNGLSLKLDVDDPTLVRELLKDTHPKSIDEELRIDLDVVERLMRSGRLIPSVE